MKVITRVVSTRSNSSSNNPRENDASQFKVIGKYRWEMTDEYGYPVKLSQVRNERIDNILDESPRGYNNSEECLSSIRYSISMRKRDEDGWGHYNFDLFKGKLSLYSTVDDESTSHLRIKFNCTDFTTAESLIDLVIQSNNMEVMPIHLATFKSK